MGGTPLGTAFGLDTGRVGRHPTSSLHFTTNVSIYGMVYESLLRIALDSYLRVPPRQSMASGPGVVPASTRLRV